MADHDLVVEKGKTVLIRDDSGRRIVIRPIVDGFEIEHMGKSTVLYHHKSERNKVLIGDGSPILRWEQYELIV